MCVITDNLRLVWHVIQKFYGGGTAIARFNSMDVEDLFQTGVVGLIRAVDRFDPDYGVLFSTYAVPMIHGEIRRCLRDHNPTVKYSRSIKEAAQRLYKLDVPPTISPEAIMDIEGCDRKFAVLVLQYMNDYSVSLDTVVFESDGDPITLQDQLSSDYSVEDDVLRKLAIAEAMNLLNPKEKIVVQLTCEGLYTQSQIGEKIGVSQVQVSRLWASALKKVSPNYVPKIRVKVKMKRLRPEEEDEYLVV